jgi:hypothetical protein
MGGSLHPHEELTLRGGSGPRKRDRVDLLGGLLYCVCGRRIRSDGCSANGHFRKVHPKPCEAWGPRPKFLQETWETPVLAQMSGMELSDGVMARIVAALGSTVRPVAIDRSRIERQMRELALEHAGGALGDETYLERMKHLRATLAEIEKTRQVGVQADVPQARSELLHAIYE